MAAIAFRGAEEKLDYYKQALDLINIIQDIIKNPGTADAVREVSKEVLAAQELSKNKKLEAREAQEVIARSNEFLEDLEKLKNAHKLQVESDLAEIESKRRNLQAEVQAFTIEKSTLQKFVEKQKQESEEKLAQARKFLEEAKIHHAKADEIESDLATREQLHASAVESLTKDKAEIQSAIESHDAARVKHEEEVRKHAEEKKAFELRKKKFYAILEE